MDTKAVDAVTRIAQNLPVPKVRTKRTTTPEGEVYFACGKGLNWHGVYAYDGPGGGVANTVEYRGPTTQMKFEEMLVITARRELAVMNTTSK